ncbi:MAG: glycine--tRNA ligase subunit alpha [Caldiserica bacterium]|nr:MAG: glycine--tRNA ligase subunit alpha [Caldisericota bacterium]
MYFQDLILKLKEYWKRNGCFIGEGYDVEKGAGTFNYYTFFKTLDSKPWRVCYVEPSRRPQDARYGENPNRLFKHYQLQVILKPAPPDSKKLYLKSLEYIGIDLSEHDIKFLEDDWTSPTLGAWGLGWEVRVDGLEITQFTYFQAMGGIELKIIPVELTYGLERIAMFLQGVNNVFDIEWSKGVSYGDIHKRQEFEFSKFHFEFLSKEKEIENFNYFYKKAIDLLNEGLIFPSYDYLLKCSHTFNSLDAYGALSHEERENYVKRIRGLAKRIALRYLENEEEA